MPDENVADREAVTARREESERRMLVLLRDAHSDLAQSKEFLVEVTIWWSLLTLERHS